MKKHFTFATTVLALILSAMAGTGMFCLLGCAMCCFDGSPDRYPIRFPFFIFTGCAALMVFIGCLWLYGIRRVKTPSVIGIAADVLGAVLLSPGFGWLFGTAVEFARRLVP